MVRMHFGSITKACDQQDVDSMNNGTLAWQYKNDALFPYDSKALVPSCVVKGQTDKEDKIVYKQEENIWLWVSIGLVGLLFLLLIVALLKGGSGGGAGTVIYR